MACRRRCADAIDARRVRMARCRAGSGGHRDGVRASRQQPRWPVGVERDVGTHDRQVHSARRACESSGRLRHREPAPDRARLPRHGKRPWRQSAQHRRRRAAQPQRRAGGQPHARRVQPEQAADVRNAGRGQFGAGHAVRPVRAARLAHAGRAAFRRGASGRRPAFAARRRLPPRSQRRGTDHRRSLRPVHRHRHPPAGSHADRRLHPHEPAAQPRAPARCRRLRHTRAFDRHVQPGRQRAHGDRAERPVGALGVSGRQPLHPRGEAGAGGSEQARAGNAAGLQGREAVAQLPECRSARRAAGDRRLHRPQHHHERHGERQPDAAPEGHSVGPGARHHHADEGPRHAQERHGRSDRAARGACAEGEAAARGPAADRRPRAADHRVVPAELREVGRHSEHHHRRRQLGWRDARRRSAPQARQDSASCRSAEPLSSTRAPTSCLSPTSRASSRKCGG